MMSRWISALVVGCIAAGSCLASTSVSERLATHVKVLADDGFQGRAPGTPGEAKSISYIVDQFKSIGLKPGGERVGKSRLWTQNVPLVESKIDGNVAISVETVGASQSWSQGHQIAVRPSLAGVARLDVQRAPLVFVGYGVTAPERNWDDFKGVNLNGKIALFLVNDPDFETGVGDFGGKAMTYYGRWTYKFEEAARRGALGALVIHETAAASYGWATISNSSVISAFDVVRSNPGRAHVLLEGWLQHEAAADLFHTAGLDYDSLKKLAQTRDFRPVALTGISISITCGVTTRKIFSHNVIGRLPGAKHPQETIIYGAHWDHLGIGPADENGDKIFNGAVDNATGVATVIEIARALANAPRADRSFVFIAWTAEERGILGSEYYAQHPVYPLATTVADVTIDALFPMGAAHDYSTHGYVDTTLNDRLIAIGDSNGRQYTPDPDVEAGLQFRSDHFPLAKHGVPGILFASGEDLIQGGRDAGHGYVTEYFAHRYHHPSDEYDGNWNLDGIAQDTDLLVKLGTDLANSREWPVWKAGAEFKAVRDQSSNQRQ